MEWHQITPGDYFAERFTQQNILREASGPKPYACRNMLLEILQVHGIFLYILLFSNTLQNAQLQKLTTNHKVWHLLLRLKNWKLLLLSCIREELQKKMNYFYIVSGLNDGRTIVQKRYV